MAIITRWASPVGARAASGILHQPDQADTDQAALAAAVGVPLTAQVSEQRRIGLPEGGLGKSSRNHISQVQAPAKATLGRLEIRWRSPRVPGIEKYLEDESRARGGDHNDQLREGDQGERLGPAGETAGQLGTDCPCRFLPSASIPYGDGRKTSHAESPTSWKTPVPWKMSIPR